MTRKHQKGIAVLVALMLTSAPSAQDPAPPQEQPRFRAGANLVRIDAYVTAGGKALSDLTINDFDVLEDGAPQRIESFQLIKPRAPGAHSARLEPNTVAESKAMAADPEARVFVLFMDVWHVSVSGSYRAQSPITKLLDRVIGQDDLVGVMTPEMSARNLTFARRTETILGILRDNWYWGQRDQLITADPREKELEMCYPDAGETAGLARAIIDRRRETKTLDAIEDLTLHLETVREERKFVVMLTEGWLLFRPDERLARPLGRGTGQVPVPGGPRGVGIGPSGRLQMDPRESGELGSCERERTLASMVDHYTRFHDILNRANRANVSFYPMDARGLVVFDSGMDRPLPLAIDAARLRGRIEHMRELALNTDGFAIVDTNAVDKALDRMVEDTSAYYLLGYYSTNTKLDGRFRKVTVRVKRPGTHVRARPGYLAPTEAEAASARVDRLMNGAAPGHTDTPPELRRALESIAPTRGPVPLRVVAAGAPGRISLTTELDAAVAKNPEWQQGGTARVMIEHSRKAAAPIQREVTLEPGQRTFSLEETGDGTLPAGRYVVRLSLLAKGASLPLQTTVDVTVPDTGAMLATSGLALRRGPATGLEYVSTADARYRRTERIRFEVSRLSTEGTVLAQLKNRAGQALPLNIAVSERVDEKSHVRFVVADLTLAPLAQGEYVLEVAVEKDGKTERAIYAFRIVP